MAWSDAARAAAAATRRAHSTAKQATKRGANSHMSRGRSVSRPASRAILAQHLRALRKGVVTPGVTTTDATRFAAASTAFRNAARK